MDTNPQQNTQITDDSPVGQYFNQIQDYIKKTIEINENELDDELKLNLKDDNMQGVINQDFNNNVSVEDCGEKIIKMIENSDVEKMDIHEQPNQIAGERGENTMERIVMNFNDFVNESKK